MQTIVIKISSDHICERLSPIMSSFKWRIGNPNNPDDKKQKNPKSNVCKKRLKFDFLHVTSGLNQLVEDKKSPILILNFDSKSPNFSTKGLNTKLLEYSAICLKGTKF